MHILVLDHVHVASHLEIRGHVHVLCFHRVDRIHKPVQDVECRRLRGVGTLSLYPLEMSSAEDREDGANDLLGGEWLTSTGFPLGAET